MNPAITIELQFFLISILCGGIILLIYDVLRIIRRLVRHDSFFVAVEDLFFWVATSLFIFAMMYKQNNGIIRGFSIMGMLIGMILYHSIISETLVSIITKFIRILLQPLVLVFRFVKRVILRIAKIGKMGIIYLLNQLKKWRKSVRITLNNKRLKKAEDYKLKKKQKNQTKKEKDEDKKRGQKTKVKR